MIDPKTIRWEIDDTSNDDNTPRNLEIGNIMCDDDMVAQFVYRDDAAYIIAAIKAFAEKAE